MAGSSGGSSNGPRLAPWRSVSTRAFNLNLFGPGTDALIIGSLFLLISIFHRGRMPPASERGDLIENETAPVTTAIIRF